MPMDKDNQNENSEPLYGDLPIRALTKLNKIWKKHDLSLYELWVSWGMFLTQYYQMHEKLDQEKLARAVADIKQSYSDEGHSGYSHMVVTQLVMKYLSGEMSEEEKEKIKNG